MDQKSQIVNENISSLGGANPHKVIELLQNRISNPSSLETDGRKLALLVEGGGMRGSVPPVVWWRLTPWDFVKRSMKSTPLQQER